MSKANIKIEARGNETDVYIYGEIGWEVEAGKFVQQFAAIDSKSFVTLHLNTVGGQVTDGLAIYNAISEHKGTTKAVVEGMAASIGATILMAADERVVMENSLVMIHNPRGATFGDADDMRKAAERLEQTQQMMAENYAKRSGKKVEDVLAMMSEETWMTGKEAHSEGFADTLIEDTRDVARFDYLDAVGMKLDSFPDQITNQILQNRLRFPKMSGATNNDGDKNTDVYDASDVVAYFKDKENTQDLMVECIEAKLSLDDAKSKYTEFLEAKSKGTKSDPEPGDKNDKNDKSDVYDPTDVIALFKDKTDCGDLLIECLEAKLDLAEARAKYIEHLESKHKKVNARTSVLETDRDKFVTGATNVLLARAGFLSEDKKDNEFELARNEFASYNLIDIARACLDRWHEGARGDRMDIIGEAFVTGRDDFNKILEDVMHKSVMRGWELEPASYMDICRVISVNDFRQHNFARITEFSGLDEIRDQQEYKFGEIDDEGANIKIATFGKLYGLSRRLIIDDDLNALTGIPLAMGRAARRLVGDKVYEVLTANNKLSLDDVALFHTTHKNVPQAGAAPGVSTLQAAFTAMGKQTDKSGAALNIMPTMAIAPRALMFTFRELLQSSGSLADNKNQGVVNTVQNLVDKVVTDSRLDANSETAWYLSSNPQSTDTIVLGFLNGNSTPFLDNQQQFTRDVILYKVRIDAGATAFDYRGLYRGNT